MYNNVICAYDGGSYGVKSCVCWLFIICPGCSPGQKHQLRINRENNLCCVAVSNPRLLLAKRRRVPEQQQWTPTKWLLPPVVDTAASVWMYVCMNGWMCGTNCKVLWVKLEKRCVNAVHLWQTFILNSGPTQWPLWTPAWLIRCRVSVLFRGNAASEKWFLSHSTQPSPLFPSKNDMDEAVHLY